MTLGGKSGIDELFEPAGKFMIASGESLIGNIQREYKIGYNRASRIMDQLTEQGVIGPDEGEFKPRKILMSMQQFEYLCEQLRP